MRVTKYVLTSTSGKIVLAGISPDTEKGFFVVEAIRKVTGKSLPGLRKHGAKLAKMNSVPFEDRT